ncbi:MAG: ABC transporter permease, partial [Oscillospiraceae bacterium]|nr:ABC transporter permease [Oscillospiraceae bacterium]
DEEAEKARIELDKARQQLAELPEAEWMILDHSMHYSTYMFENNSDQMWKIGYVFPMLFFLVAALVCMTTMKRLVDEQRSQIGIFSALGFSKGKIISKYVIYALTASLLGSVIAIPLGMAMFPTVIYFCWRLMYDLPDMVLTMPTYIAVLGVCSFTLLMILVTTLVVRSILKENPSRLMRPKAPKNAKKVFLEKIPFIWKRMSFTSKVTARNIIRYKSRFFMTVIGVAGCTSLLVLGFAIKGSISQVVSIQYGDIITYNTTVTMEDTDRLEEVHRKLLTDDNVQFAVPLTSYSSMAYTDEKENTINVHIMDEADIPKIFNLRQRTSGDPLTVEDGVVISEKFSRLCGVSVGDEITIESSNGIKKQVEVAGICEMYTQHYLFISEEMYEDVFNETVVYDTIAVTATDSETRINKYQKELGVKNIADFTAMKATFNNMFDSLDIIIVVITLVAGSLSLVVIMNLTEVNISERIREIATLKVLGFNNGEVYSYIFKEVFILSMIGMLVGLPFGKLELVFVMDIIDMEMVMFPTIVQPTSYIYAAIITLVFTVFVILLMRKTLRNVEMVESLKSVE